MENLNLDINTYSIKELENLLNYHQITKKKRRTTKINYRKKYF